MKYILQGDHFDIFQASRDNKGFWQEVESYVSQHSDASFSHALCPDCTQEYYRELEILKKKTGKS
jgi:hypothetical protein